jgi:hypothetical protein
MGCPGCGSDRLKSASAPLWGAAFVAAGRRRYRCVDCGWIGWKHRLRRRQHSGVSLQQRESPDARAVWFFGLVVTFLAISTILLLRACESVSIS